MTFFQAIVASTLTFLLAAASAQAQEAKGDPIKIGAVVPETGPGAALGRSAMRGVRLAEKYVNENGGIGGRPLLILHEDDRTNPDTAISKANHLLHTQQVVAIIGA